MSRFETFTATDPNHDLVEIEHIVEEIDRERINLKSFEGHKSFTRDEIDKDLFTSKMLWQNFEQQRKKFDTIQREAYERGLRAEYVLRHVIEEHGWLADDVKVIPTSQYDDFARHIDSVAQISTGEGTFEFLGLAIDFTSGAEDIGPKLRKSFADLDQGSCPSVKYFDSAVTGKVKDFAVPRVIIGAGAANMERLSAYCSEVMSGSGISESVREEIKNDSYRYVLFAEIIMQLDAFVNRLKKVCQEAERKHRKDIKERATESLKIHEKALTTVKQLAINADIDITSGSNKIRGDRFAVKMASDLSELSRTLLNEFHLKNQVIYRTNENSWDGWF